MSQSTKLFIVLGFMFILFTTMNGHLEKYLKIIFGKKSKNSGSFKSGMSGMFDSTLINVADDLLAGIGLG